MDDKLNHAVRSVLYRENGKTTVSHLLGTLRIMGWKRLGTADDFMNVCTKAGYLVDYQYNTEGKVTRTFILLPILENQ